MARHLARRPRRLRREALVFLHYLPNGARLRAIYKGNTYKARARRDGRISFNGRKYPSLSKAASSVVKRPTNGWWFWKVERGRRNWVRLIQIRRAGTPIYSR